MGLLLLSQVKIQVPRVLSKRDEAGRAAGAANRGLLRGRTSAPRSGDPRLGTGEAQLDRPEALGEKVGRR